MKRLVYFVLALIVGVPAAVLAASGRIGNNPFSDPAVMLLAGVSLIYLARMGRKVLTAKDKHAE